MSSPSRLPLWSRLACVLLIASLTACAHYSPVTSNPAKLRDGQLRRSWFDWDSFWLVEIDSQPVGESFIKTPAKIDAGQHLLLVFHKGNRPMEGFVSGGYLLLAANLEPAKMYDIAASSSYGVVRAWIRDTESGKAVSEPVERPVMPIQGQNAPMIIPIVVPSR